MRRSLLALAAGGTLLAGSLLGGTALAQDGDATGPDTQACAEATGLAETRTEAALALGLDLGVTTAEIDRLLGVVTDDGPNAGLAGEKLAAVRVALDAQAAAEVACSPAQGDDQGDGGADTPGNGDEPGSGDDSGQGGGDQDGPPIGGNVDDQDGSGLTPGETCSTVAIPSGVVATDGECVPAGSTSTGSGSTAGGGQVSTIPRGHADTGGGPE